MSEKSLETQFNKELDQYISGENLERQGTSSEEYDALLSIGKALWDDKVCENINEDKLRSTFMAQLEQEKENEKMKKGKSLRKVIVAASMAAVLGGCISQTALAKEFINAVKEQFTTGHVSVLQIDSEKAAAERQARIEERKNEPMPEEYKGKIFDADGNEFTYFPAYLEGAYNANGEPIICTKDGEVYTEEEWNKYCEAEEEEEGYTEITDIEHMNDYTCFDVKMPTYLPTGVTFKNAGVWSEANVTDNQCIEINFVNEKGKEVIYMQQRLNCEEAACETGTYDTVVEVDINGAKGLMYDNSLDWETEDTIYMLMSLDDSVTRDEMIKIARSIK